MSYALGDGSPAWLSLDSASRTLSGTPNDNAVPPDRMLVGVPVILEAKDDTGTVVSNTTLVISRSRAPVVRVPLEDQTDMFGPNSAPSSVLFHPSTGFSFGFDANTFAAAPGQDTHRGLPPQLNFYAVSGDNAPLPSWITFDAGKLVFAGTTPPFESLIQPPQTFDFKLVASDVVGFSATSIDFSIVAGPHELTAGESFVELNATIGKKLQYTGLSDLLKIDSQPLRQENITSIQASGLPTWLSFNETTWEVSGTPGTGTTPANITISIVDKFPDTLNLTLAIEFESKLFVSSLPSLDLSAGSELSFDLNRFLLAPGDTEVKAQTDTEWIKFDESSKVLTGVAPEPLAAGFSSEVKVSFTATHRSATVQQTEDLNIHVNTPLPPAGRPESGPSARSGHSRRELYRLLVIPILAVAIVLLLVFLAIRRRRERSRILGFSHVAAPMSGALMISKPTNAMVSDTREVMEHGSPVSSIRSRTSSKKHRTAQTRSSQSLGTDHTAPHALTLYSGVASLGHRGHAFVGVGSPLATDELSMSSATSAGDQAHRVEGGLPVDFRNLEPRLYGRKTGLDVLENVEPFSIQPTPAPAYNRHTRRYGYIPDDNVPPTVGYTARRRSRQRHSNGATFRKIQARLSKAWKRGTPSRLAQDAKRNSYLSDVTTRTSILTYGITDGTTEEATAANTNLVARPTVIHIPSRPGDRRTNGSLNTVTLVSGHAPTKSYRNLDGTNTEITGWDQTTRDSLGIAYKDVIQLNSQGRRLFGNTIEGRTGATLIGNWKTHRTKQEILSSGLWPVPGNMRSEESPSRCSSSSQSRVSWTCQQTTRSPLSNKGWKARMERQQSETLPGLRAGQATRSTQTWIGTDDGGDDNDEDAWEDIIPAESTRDGWEGDDSRGSFAVYI
ncbi:hypothetical protein F5Y17DRAFT_459055 [Xylariaceae sp. FL0594]|nr:hypothetical protein F5Y17DRAFT_459055 [Xylariaceae sp. FL0594]